MRKFTSRKSKFLSPEILEHTAQVVIETVDGAVIAGGFAMQLYGSDRLTGDLDFLVLTAPTNVRTEGTITFGGVKAKIGGVPVDFIVRDDQHQALYEEAIDQAAIFDETMQVVDPDYLVAIKLAAGRPKDMGDVLFLLKSPVVDLTRIQKIVKKHLGEDGEQALEVALWEAKNT